MDLSALHDAVRSLARGEKPVPSQLAQVDASERAAVRTLWSRIRAAGGETNGLVPAAGTADWALAASPELVR
ncbi:MAG: hypothetical protein QOF51_3775 [Chloroflexota bacterium]|jgi:hypothetical protein|nr:hypothetical protein [Chloroflexota bacterium]